MVKVEARSRTKVKVVNEDQDVDTFKKLNHLNKF